MGEQKQNTLDSYISGQLTADDITTLVRIIEILGEWCRRVAPFLHVHGADTGGAEGEQIQALIEKRLQDRKPR